MAGIVRCLVLDSKCEKVLGSVHIGANYNTDKEIRMMRGHSIAADLVGKAIKGDGQEQFVKALEGHKGGFTLVRLASVNGQDCIRIDDDGNATMPTLSNIYLQSIKGEENVQTSDAGVIPANSGEEVQAEPKGNAKKKGRKA